MSTKNEFRLVLKCYHVSAFTNHIYLRYMYKEDLTLNNLQWLICPKTSSGNIWIRYSPICSK